SYDLLSRSVVCSHAVVCSFISHLCYFCILIPVCVSFSLHDALPSCLQRDVADDVGAVGHVGAGVDGGNELVELVDGHAAVSGRRSEEHTSELQSRENIVCRLLLEKKKKQKLSSSRSQATIKTRYGNI